MRRFLTILAVGLVLGFILYKPLLNLMGSCLVFSQTPQRADVIIALAGDFGREDYAARLYREGYAPKILVSGGLVGWQTTYAGIIKKHLQYLGVPKGDILLEEKSTSTYENALFCLPIVKKHEFKTILLVTSPYHSRRAYFVFNKLFKDAKIKIISCPEQNGWFKLENWWTRRDEVEVVSLEYLRMLFYIFRY